MDQTTFEEKYDSLTRLNNSDGPPQNIFEPKFQARKEMESLLVSVTNIHLESPSLDSQIQISRCDLFIGNTMIETEETDGGFVFLLRSHHILSKSVRGVLLDKSGLQEKSNLTDILRLGAPEVDKLTGFRFVREYISCLNTLGLHMCSTESPQKMNDAKKILHLSEQCHKAWDAFFIESGGVTMQSIPMTDEGFVSMDVEGRDMMLLRHRMDSLYTSTLFFLAQAYTQSNPGIASKYAHLTMVHQLLTRSEFSKKSWAENALHLCGFYAGQYQYGKALHCLEAGRYMMPKNPDDEETTGRVVWAFGRYYLSRLRYYSSYPSFCDLSGDESDSWFVPFPLPLPSIEIQPHITTFEEARDEFKKANFNLKLASKYFAFDGQCTDHILILKDISEAYKYLSIFETDVERQVAMHSRRLALLEGIPSELNPQAYLTTIRQLYFDIGDIANDIFDARLRQKKSENHNLGKPLSDKGMNTLNEMVKGKYEQFLNSFNGDSQPEEVRVAIFRAKMRVCSLMTKRFHKNPKEEYDTITLAIEAYSDVILFAQRNPMGDEIFEELELAKQMCELLPGKKRAIAQAFQKTN